jgi:3-oxoacyl-(acyl-carrier-protein) synthase
MTAGISRWAAWTAKGVTIGGDPPDLAPGPIAAWNEAPPLSKIHPKARRPHPQAKALVQLAYSVIGERRLEGLALTFGSRSGSAGPDREFDQELKKKGAGFGSPSLFVYTLPSAPLGEVAVAFGARGPITTVSAGSASALAAVATAIADVDSGRAPAVLCGGFEWGTQADYLALFLIEPMGPITITGETGYGEQPDDEGARGDVLDLMAAVASGQPFSLIASDPLGFWAQISSAGELQ